MNWTQVNEGRLEAPGFIMHITAVNERITVYVVRLAQGVIIYAGQGREDADTACREHMRRMAPPLNYVIGGALG